VGAYYNVMDENKSTKMPMLSYLRKVIAKSKLIRIIVKRYLG